MLRMLLVKGGFKVSSLVAGVILMNWVGDTFRHALTDAEMGAMPVKRRTHECEIVTGRGTTVLPRPLAGALPGVPATSRCSAVQEQTFDEPAFARSDMAAKG
jgi:hypothetical protein